MKQRLDLKVTDLGATQLKNIIQPVRVFSLEVGQPAEAKPKALAPRPRRAPAPLALPLAALVLPGSAIARLVFPRRAST